MRLLITLFAFLLSVTLYGQNDYSMSFDGDDDYVDIGTPNQLEFMLHNSFSLSLWVYIDPAEIVTKAIYKRGDGYSGGENKNISLLYVGVQNKLLFQMRSCGSCSNESALTTDCQGIINNPGWYYITCVRDWGMSTSTLYVYDNVGNTIILDNQTDLCGAINFSSNPNHYIGAAFEYSNLEPQAMQDFFNGNITDVQIWNTTLAQSEIQQYMSCPPSGNEEGLVGYWNFEEGSGTTVFDQTENGNDGTINGATYSLDVPSPNTSYTDITACDSVVWNGITYDSSGTYFYSGGTLPGNISGFTYQGTYNGNHYYKSNSTAYWVDANQTCVDNGGYLVTISSQEENDLIHGFIEPVWDAGCGNVSGCWTTEHFWIGLTDELNEGDFVWVTEEGDNFTNWLPNQPDNYGGNQNYAILEGSTGQWDDSGDFPSWYILEIPSQLTNINGCDSTAVLNLTINLPDTSYTDITACDSVVWNGSTYSESGTYSFEGETNNYSMSLDGASDEIVLGNNLNLNNEITILTWINFEIGGTNWPRVISNDYNSCNGFELITTGTGSQRQILFHYNCSAGASGWVSGNINISANTWHHIALVHNGQEASIYIDGVLDATNSSPAQLGTSNMYPIVGQRGDGLCRYKGSVDDLLIWNTALSQQEIQQYMNCPPAVSESGLVGYWNFEEGSGSTASDQTANANNGTINGATYETNVPESCALTNINGCDSTAVLNLTMLPCDAVSTFCGEGTVWDADSQECIVANPTDTNFDGCTDLNDLLDILSAYGECAVSEFTCGDEIEHENYSYSTVQIGDQCWFNENCCYLPEVSPSNEGSETDPYYYVYDYQGTDIEEAKATDNYETYGVLYNWPAVMTEAICPTSWHVPSDGEWQTMEVSLGMSESEASSFGWRGTDEGYQMKSTSGWWYNDDNGSNSSGFSGLPGGYRGGFVLGMYQVGVDGYWWTSSEADSNSFKRGLGDGLSNPNKVARALFNPNGGISARCIKD